MTTRRRRALIVLLGACAASAFPTGSLAQQPPRNDTPVIRAQLTARRFTTLSAELGAKIQRLHVAEGTAFSAGAVLVEFEDSVQRAQLARAQAVLIAAEKLYASNQRLHALNSIGKIELQASEAELAKARAEVSIAESMTAKCRIIAPFAGRVSDQKVRELEFVQPGQPLIEIVDSEVPQIDFIAPSRWLAWLHAGQALQVQIDETGQTYGAVIERIGAKVDPVSQSIKVVATVSQKAPELIAGMSGCVLLSPPKP